MIKLDIYSFQENKGDIERSFDSGIKIAFM